MEVLIVTLLLGVVFYACMTVYVAVLGAFFSVRSTMERVDTMLATETVARKIMMGNAVIIDDGGQQIRVRMDYPQNSTTCNNTPKSTADDTWVKYRIIGEKLYWRHDTPGSPEQDPVVSNSDPEVAPGFKVMAGSGFTLRNPTSTGSPTVVNVHFVGSAGRAAADNVAGTDRNSLTTIVTTYDTDVALGAAPKN